MIETFLKTIQLTEHAEQQKSCMIDSQHADPNLCSWYVEISDQLA